MEETKQRADFTNHFPSSSGEVHWSFGKEVVKWRKIHNFDVKESVKLKVLKILFIFIVYFKKMTLGECVCATMG